MKKWMILFIMLMFAYSVSANETYIKKYSGYPQGTFKKARNGKIIQYDKNGKKVGVYKLNSEKYLRIK